MTVIRPNGISGITSITSSGDAINFFKSDGTLGPVLGLNINATSGISTFAALNVTGVLTYEDVTSVDSVGIITARSDLSIADKIIHTGDTNTAIRFPAADTVTVETSGSEALRIDSSGRVLIGNTADGSLFHSGANNFIVGSGSGHEGMSIYAGTTSNSSIMFADGTGSNSYAGYIQFAHNTDTIKFGIQGNDAMYIDSNKRVLIGTPTEGHADADDLTLQAPSGYTGITLRSGTTTGGAIYFSDATSGTGELDGQIVYSQNSRTMTFATAGVTKLTLKSDGLLVSKAIQATANVTPTSGNGVEVFAPTSSVGQIQAYDRDNSQWNDFIIKGQTIQIYANNSERLRIDSSGRMGLGTNSPTDHGGYGGTLEISGSPGGALYLKSGSDVGQLGMNSSGLQLRTRTAKDILFTTNNTERMRIDSSGDVSIGRSAGNARLDVYGTITTTLGNSNLLNVGSGAAAGYYHTIGLGPTINGYTIAPSAIGYLTEQSTDGTYGHLVFATRNVTTDTAPSERMRINRDGNLGIGNDASFPIFTDDRSLILGAGSGSVGLQLYSSTTGYNGIYFGDANTGGDRYKGYIEYKHNDDWLRFAVNGQERVRITSSGRMGVGTNNPAIKLHVVDSSSTPIRLQNTGGGSVYTQYVNNDNARGYVGYEGKRLAFYADNGSNTGDTRVAFMDADGLKFFNDTSSANALDDYEQGSCTITISTTGGGGNYAANNTAGYYVKVGNVVTVSYYTSTVAVTSAGSGTVQLSGLPFASFNANHHYAVASFTHTTLFAQTCTGGYLTTNGTTISCIQDSNTAGATMAGAGSRYLMFSITYRTN